MSAGSGNDYPDELIEGIAALSRLVVANEDVSSTVRQIADLAVHAIDGAEVCSVSLGRNAEIETVASTAAIGEQIDQVQYETKEGPCLSSIDRERTFHIADMEHDDTWPTFSKRVAADTGAKSMLSYVLDVHEGALGALNLTSTEKDSFSPDDVATGSLFAAQAGVALANALTHEADQQHVHQLEEALMTRQLIGQAVGLVMASQKVDSDAAFNMLVRISQNTNVKLRDLAERLIDRSSDA